MAEGSLHEVVQNELGRGRGDLPVLPRSSTQALALARSADLELGQAARLAEGDPVLAARVLSVANSALYARGTRITSVHAALVRLGVKATRDVLLQAAYAGMLFDVPGYRERIEATFAHGVVVGKLARQLAELGHDDAGTAFLTGLLHDVGKARCLGILARKSRIRVDAKELEAVLDALHPRAGAELAAHWRLPAEVIEACEWHHVPGERRNAQLVRAADVLAHAVTSPQSTPATAVARAIEALGMGAQRVDELLRIASETILASQ